MRPLLLTMRAFGPFPGEEKVDFTRFGRHPLFLINGPTGAGKTTILDAICFALYGRTTGNEREGAQMRCDLADPAILTEVSLDFTLGERRFLLRRVPEQQRPKSRGDGTTTQMPEAQLREIFADGSEKLLVASKVNDATRTVEELTGLSVEQFRQVMVLPQGQFRQLLLAESAEREKIFSQLFQTGIYRRLEEFFKEEAAQIRRERQTLGERDSGILAGAGVAGIEELNAAVAETVTARDAAALDKDRAEALWMAAARSEEQGRALAAACSEAERLQNEEERLQRDEEIMAATRQQVADALRAAALLPIFAEEERCGRELEQQSAALARAEAELAQSCSDEVAAESALTAALVAAGEQEALRREIARLEAAHEALLRLQAAADLARAAAAVLEAGRQNEARGLAALADAEKRRRALELQGQQAQLDIHRLAELRLQQATLKSHHETLLRLQALEQSLADAQIALSRSERAGQQRREECDRCRRELQEMELLWHQGQAALLAAELQVGHPCPVCGSTEHPLPAVSRDPLPDAASLEQARQRLQQAEEQLGRAREEFAGQRSRVQELMSQAEALRPTIDPQQPDLTESITRLAGFDAEMRRLTAVVAAMETFNAKLLQYRNEEERLSQEFEGLRAQTADAATAAAAAQGRVESLRQSVPAELRDARQLDVALTALRHRDAELKAGLEAARLGRQAAHGRREHATATQQAAFAAQRLAAATLQAAAEKSAAALTRAGFAERADWEKARCSETELARLQAALQAHETRRLQVAGALEQARRTIGDAAPPDLDALAAALAAAAVERSAQQKRWQELEERSNLLAATKALLADAAAERQKLDERYRIVGTLSDTLNGQTGQRVSLQRFVLGVLLDDVLREAGVRLQRMSRGRYLLRRRDEKSKGNRASGLELEVEDAYTGRVRPVATLSGGESFMAALALALGLSDVVQAYAGGIRLDTLFIDEGFGSLDSDALDLAIRTLLELQASGRMIGIISHVAELKEQIPLRLDVFSGPRGSSLRLVVP